MLVRIILLLLIIAGVIAINHQLGIFLDAYNVKSPLYFPFLIYGMISGSVAGWFGAKYLFSPLWERE